MSIMRTDLDRALAVIQAATQFDWTWTTDDLPSFAALVGWQVDDLDQRLPTITTNLDVNRTDAMVYLRYNAPPGTPRPIKSLWYYFTDVFLDDSSVKLLLDNAFDELTRQVRYLVEQPPAESWTRDPDRMLRWDLPNLVLKVMVNNQLGEVVLISPASQARDDEFDRMLESSDEDAG
ncbi:hypothetical protein NOVA_14550 [Nocardia nova]|uniref:DUF6301 family protein n=1 Tax=Nocardia nova TaxID=37330 RepID=UPI001C440F1A|nr:DUF6301 family protein [Nocardia nova]MBV7703996.1 hypothetical protein [Nocardia nova]